MWKKNEAIYDGGGIVLNNRRYLAPTSAQFLSAGWTEVPDSSGGSYLPVPEVVSSGGSVGYIPVLSGGKVYRFSEPLITLSIGSITDTPVEDTILFSAGGVVTPPASMSVHFLSAYWNDNWWETVYDSKAITLVSSGGSYMYNPDGFDNWSEVQSNGNMASSLLSGGSFVGISSGGTITISAHNVGVYWTSGYYDDMEGQFVGDSGMSSLNGLVASSTNGGSSWTFGGLMILCYYYTEWNGLEGDFCQACKAEYSPIVTPCAEMLPSGAELVGSSKIELESGHHYEMNIANGGVVVAERFAQEASE